MDVQMPEMDGFEATAAIRAQERENGKHLPIIAMTAHAMQGDRERSIAAGMDDYIAKPIKFRELTDLLDKMSDAAQEKASSVKQGLATRTVAEGASLYAWLQRRYNPTRRGEAPT